MGVLARNVRAEPCASVLEGQMRQTGIPVVLLVWKVEVLCCVFCVISEDIPTHRSSVFVVSALATADCKFGTPHPRSTDIALGTKAICSASKRSHPIERMHPRVFKAPGQGKLGHRPP